jgi:hypothetical protein
VFETVRDAPIANDDPLNHLPLFLVATPVLLHRKTAPWTTPPQRLVRGGRDGGWRPLRATTMRSLSLTMAVVVTITTRYVEVTRLGWTRAQQEAKKSFIASMSHIRPFVFPCLSFLPSHPQPPHPPPSRQSLSCEHALACLSQSLSLFLLPACLEQRHCFGSPTLSHFFCNFIPFKRCTPSSHRSLDILILFAINSAFLLVSFKPPYATGTEGHNPSCFHPTCRF